jgi:hypothetical protein
LWVDGTFDDRFDLTADAGPNGRFSVGLPVELLAILESGIFAEAEALFLGTQRYAPCRSGRQVLRR